MAKIRCIGCDLGRSRSGWFDFGMWACVGLLAPCLCLAGLWSLTLVWHHGGGSVNSSEPKVAGRSRWKDGFKIANRSMINAGGFPYVGGTKCGCWGVSVGFG